MFNCNNYMYNHNRCNNYANNYDNCIEKNFNSSDYGDHPFIVNIDDASINNANYRTALWTGDNLQITLMSIPVDSDIGLEIHEELDQFLRIEEGCALVVMGKCKDNMNYKEKVDNHYGIVVPANTWHNVINIGDCPLKLYSVYAPPKHPFGTIHKTKADAQMYE